MKTGSQVSSALNSREKCFYFSFGEFCLLSEPLKFV